MTLVAWSHGSETSLPGRNPRVRRALVRVLATEIEVSVRRERISCVDEVDRKLPELFSQAEWRALNEALGLARRQGQIARLICRGYTNAEIAVELGTSFDTVRMHTRALYRRLRVGSRVGVAVRVVLAQRRLRGRVGDGV